MDILFELMEDYLVDQEDGMKKLLAWFLNWSCSGKQYNNRTPTLTN